MILTHKHTRAHHSLSSKISSALDFGYSDEGTWKWYFKWCQVNRSIIYIIEYCLLLIEWVSPPKNHSTSNGMICIRGNFIASDENCLCSWKKKEKKKRNRKIFVSCQINEQKTRLSVLHLHDAIERLILMFLVVVVVAVVHLIFYVFHHNVEWSDVWSANICWPQTSNVILRWWLYGY